MFSSKGPLAAAPAGAGAVPAAGRQNEAEESDEAQRTTGQERKRREWDDREVAMKVAARIGERDCDERG